MGNTPCHSLSPAVLCWAQGLEGERADQDQKLKSQDETQRQLNDCLAFKLSKQTEEELGQSIDQVTAQIGDVSCSSLHTCCTF